MQKKFWQPIIKLTLLTVMLLLPSFSFADSSFQGRWYQIELIVFSQVNKNALEQEYWPAIQPDFAKLNSLPSLSPSNTPATLSTPFVSLPRRDFKMDREQYALEHNKNYQVLMHVSWRQPVYGPFKAKPIHLVGGQQLPQNNWQINGTFKISVQRFFNVNLNLLFAMPSSQSASGYQYYRLLQSRRMRSKELNYLGQPLFGVLVLVSPTLQPATTT